jgi:hypothetical protein
MTVFWVVAPCSLVEVYRRFSSHRLMMDASNATETTVNFYQTCQKTAIFMLAAVRT